ncbi:hypothetical protein ACFPYJ_01615 [Paenibacillus solisilvae]|uniref:Uncharacterized protein n=1 Tax=Paenibacillus solisilvae TaxID=2486751 RepID=A0ABW0VPL9_9BACL
MMNEKKNELTALIEGFAKKSNNVEARLQELKAERQTLQATVTEAQATFQNVVTQVSMGTNGYSNRNVMDSKKKLSLLNIELKDVSDVIDTLEDAKKRELAKLIPQIEKAYMQYASAFNDETILPLHEDVHRAKIMYLGALAKVKNSEAEPSQLLQEVQNVRYQAGVREENRNLRYSAPVLNVGARATLGENDTTTRIEPSEIQDMLTGNIRMLPRVQAFVKHGKVFLKTKDAEDFLKNPITEDGAE